MRITLWAKARFLSLVAFMVLAAASAQSPGELVLQDCYYRPIRLDVLAGAHATVLFFFSNTCPVARRYLPRVAQLESAYRARGVRFIGVNASPADTVRDVAAHALAFGVEYPVLKDADFTVVRALGVTRTPEVVLLDPDFNLCYQGRVDDQYRLGGARTAIGSRDLARALDAVLAGETVPVTRTQAEGCVITFPNTLWATERLTYFEHVRPLLGEHCVPCHHSAGAAPFALDTLEDLVRRKEALLRVVRDTQMPPWHAAIENPWLTPRALTIRQQNDLSDWLLGSMVPGTPLPASPSLPPAYDRSLTAAAAVTREAGGRTVDIKLEPAIETEIWARAIQIQGAYEGGFRWARAYYTNPERDGERHYLAGPLLPGQPLRWAEGEAMRIPAGVSVHLIAACATPSRATVIPLELHIETARGPVHREISCITVVTSPGQGDTRDAEVELALPPRASLRCLTPDIATYGVALAVDFVSPERAAVRLLTIPAYDPRWPQPYHLSATPPEIERGGHLHAAFRFPRYLTAMPDGRQNADVNALGGAATLALFAHIAQSRAVPLP